MKTKGGKLLTTQSVYITKVDKIKQERQTDGSGNDRSGPKKTPAISCEGCGFYPRVIAVYIQKAMTKREKTI